MFRAEVHQNHEVSLIDMPREYSTAVGATEHEAVCAALVAESTRPYRRAVAVDQVRLVGTGQHLHWWPGGGESPTEVMYVVTNGDPPPEACADWPSMRAYLDELGRRGGLFVALVEPMEP